MFLRAGRKYAKLGAVALVSTPLFLSPKQTHAEQRVYTSGEALGRGVRRELWKAQHENVVVLDLESELIKLGMTRIRDYANAGAKFTHDANAVLRSTLDLALSELPSDDNAVVTTPRGYKVDGVLLEDNVKVCGISIAAKPEAQICLSRVLRTCLPFEAKFGEILVQEVANGGNTRIAKTTLPDGLEQHEVFLLMPEFALISQVDKIIHLLKHHGAEEDKLTLVTLVTCPEAVDRFCKVDQSICGMSCAFRDARLVTASFDSRLNNDSHIVPGIGSFEERYLGAPSSMENVIDDLAEKADDEDAPIAKITSKISSWLK
ncbi:hypothetical protein CCR75_007674 [Bremia lactucae]|uniref:Phosphoribosyltransferase domain-containing protein n=1 Tax=Bremia lactucae TaxID=4779 RepID=A0A976IKU3_BRELC|nr:hypothetical protein CCR75_007674 [Bremia lactucae]